MDFFKQKVAERAEVKEAVAAAAKAAEKVGKAAKAAAEAAQAQADADKAAAETAKQQAEEATTVMGLQLTLRLKATKSPPIGNG